MPSFLLTFMTMLCDHISEVKSNRGIKMDLRKSIRHAMASIDCSQGEFADRSKITRPYLSSIMNGHTKPGIIIVERMAEAAGMPVSRFIELGEG